MKPGDGRSGSWVSRVTIAAVATGAALTGSLSAQAYTRPGGTERVSGTSFVGVEAQGSLWALSSAISDNGRFVAFESPDPTLVKGDDKLSVDAFLHDRERRTTELVTMSSEGVPGVAPPAKPGNYLGSDVGSDPSISTEGRYVAFSSPDVNLVTGDTNLVSDIFLRDLELGKTTRLSVSSTGEEGEAGRASGTNSAGSFDPYLTGNGRFVTFTSASPNLVPGDSNGETDIFIRDLARSTTKRVSVALDGGDPDKESECPSASENGRFIVFNSTARNLVSGTNDTGPGGTEIYVRDRSKGTTEMVSVDSAGHRGRGLRSLAPGACGQSAISGDGRYVVFAHVTKFVPNDNGALNRNVYLHDRQTGRTTKLSVNSYGEESVRGSDGQNMIGSLAISRDGRFVAFSSFAGDLAGEDEDRSCRQHPLSVSDCGPLGGDMDAFIHDVVTGATELVSADISSSNPDDVCRGVFNDSSMPAISSNGRFVSFASCAGSHAPEDHNRTFDVFVRDRGVPLGSDLRETSGTTEGPCVEEVCVPQICVAGICIPPGGARTARDGGSGYGDADVFVQQGSKLFGASLAYRPQYEDLFAAIELEHMPQVLPGLSPIFYGLRFEVEGKSYEVRATSFNFGTFGLFDCTGSRPFCTKVADLRGGYGTTGMRVVFALPLDAIGLHDGGNIRDVEAFSGFGSYLTGAARILDTVKLR